MTDGSDDNCYGYNFNWLYLLWSAVFAYEGSPAMSRDRKLIANVPHIASSPSHRKF